jgi:hypothetical protein
MSHWNPALRSLETTESGIYGPKSFIGYLRDTDEDPSQYRTADELSIDTRQQLSDRLDERGAMIFRLGKASDGPGTQFALVDVAEKMDDFFINEGAFDSDSREMLNYTTKADDTLSLGQSTQDMLDVYRSLPTFSETSLVNFALSIGILSRALGLDTAQIGIAPTTVASTFDFQFEPHPDHPTVVHHNSGQVEIDGLIMTRRGGERILLVIEAKRGRGRKLAKHKIGYPTLAAEMSLSLTVDQLVPVYLRAHTVGGDDDMIRYSIYECSDIPIGEAQPCLTGLSVINDHHYQVRLG